MIICLDTETTGTDFSWGVQPFFITICDDTGNVSFCEFNVDPITRKVAVQRDDVEQVRTAIDGADLIIGQNIKFDCHALATIGVTKFPWRRARDTIVAGHLLHSGMPHNLTAMVLQYLGEDIEHHERELEAAVKDARRLVEREELGWRIARKDDEQNPSFKGMDQVWRADYWLPRAVALHHHHPHPVDGCEHRWLDDLCVGCGGHRWWTVLRDYANADSVWTLPLWFAMEREVRAKNLWAFFEAGMQLPEVIANMERGGATVDLRRLDELVAEYKEKTQAAGELCVKIAKSYDYDLELPKGAANNNSLRHFCFGWDEVTCPKRSAFAPDAEGCGRAFRWGKGEPPRCPKCKRTEGLVVDHRDGLNLPPESRSEKTGEPSLDKDAFTAWELTLDQRSKAGVFTKAFAGKRKQETTVSYLESYKRFGVPTGDGFIVLHPNLNQTGTAHLRMSSDNPNSQNCGKQQETCKACEGTGEVRSTTCVICGGEGEVSYNVRRCFGPAPGREWWAFDFENIELRIPAYECGERKMIELFERPNDPPYFGSQHLLNASVVYPDLFWPIAEQKGEFKRRYGSTWYQWIKNFDFALSYGCGREKGDATARKSGAYALIKSSFKELAKLNSSWISYANRHGYVETVPDKTVDPARGYPIMCGRGERGEISPTLPFNYHVSGSAMLATRKAMVRTWNALHGWNHQDRGADRRMILQVHDEIVYDFPAGGVKNLPEVNAIKDLMEKSGDDFGIPLRVAVSYHPKNWAEAVKLKEEAVAA